MYMCMYMCVFICIWMYVCGCIFIHVEKATLAGSFCEIIILLALPAGASSMLPTSYRT